MARMIGEGNGEGGDRVAAAYPPLDIIDRGNVLVVRAMVPGVSKEYLDISIEARHLFLRGRRPMEEETGAYFRHERILGNFNRAVDLPVTVDPDRSHAHLENGILELTLPKLEPARPRRVEVH